MGALPLPAEDPTAPPPLTIEVNFVVANPGALTSTEYDPTGNNVAVNAPNVSVVTFRTDWFVASLITVIVASATADPVGSCTVPVMAPVAPPCAKANTAIARIATN